MKEEETITKQLQQVELEMLKEFIKVCEKINVNYYLIGGTLLGAVRHKGFIPWDDDIDVCMLRKDYNKFISEAQKYLSKELFLQTYETDPQYPHCFAKIRNSNTTFIETSINDKNINHGTYIDIFPIDNYYRLNIFQRYKLKLINYQLFKKSISEKNKKNIIKKVYMIVSNIMMGRKTSQQLCKIKDDIFQYNNNDKSNKITNYNGAWGIKKETHNIDDFAKYKIVDFEHLKCKIPIGYDTILTNTYGDYMKLPPKEKRIAHHYTDVIDLKKSYKEYINVKENS